ncbi:MAG TPA: Na+/H+ antiporter NhaC family protein [Firmicutes bacterium]|nr:Na+/H+ antiporter NhaC family protein [Bacillota bacterium]
MNGYNPGVGLLRSIDEFIVSSVADPWYAGLLIFTMLIAGMLAIVTRAGGATAIAEALARKTKTARGGMLVAWFMGMVIFFDDYTSCIITGNTVRPLTDKLRISREKLSYIVDSTAAPIATIALVSTWIGFELGVIGDSLAAAGIGDNVYMTFLQTIPYRFYSLFSIAMVLILAITLKDYGPMYEAEVRARKTGKLLRDGAVPLAAQDAEEIKPKEGAPQRSINFILPVAILVAATFIGLYINGGGSEAGLRDAFGNADSVVVLLWTSLIGTVVTILLVMGQKILTLIEALDTLIAGAKSVFIAVTILVLAWSLSAVSDALGTAEYVVQLVETANVPAGIVPLAIFLIACFMAFAMGTSWGTMGIILPLAVPISLAVGSELLPTIGAVMTGAIFGDHCSPLSDTTILSSTGAGSDHIDHVRTQIPYALTVAAVSGIAGFIPAGYGLSPIISIVLGVGALIAIIHFFGKKVEGVDIPVETNENISG